MLQRRRAREFDKPQRERIANKQSTVKRKLFVCQLLELDGNKQWPKGG
jgi:hypothetical protein